MAEQHDCVGHSRKPRTGFLTAHIDVIIPCICLLTYTHCLDRTLDCTFLGTGSFLPRWRTGKPSRGRYLFYNHFISILIVIQNQRPDLRTLYAFLQSSLVSLSPKTYRYGYGGIISSPFVYILIFSDDPNMYISFLRRIA